MSTESTDARLKRTELLLGRSAMDRLKRSTVLVAGLGGTGGGLAVTLARMGVGRIILADPGAFDEPDFNRQWAASSRTQGRNKAEVYAETLRDAAPGIAVEVHPEGIQRQNVAGLVEEADVVCDNLDVKVPLALRGEMLQLAREHGRYSVSCPILGFGAFLAVAAPDGCSMEAFLRRLRPATRSFRMPGRFDEVYQPEHLRIMEDTMAAGTVPSMAITPLLSSALAATETVLVLLKGDLDPWREPITLPKVLMVDLFRMRYTVADIAELD